MRTFSFFFFIFPQHPCRYACLSLNFIGLRISMFWQELGGHSGHIPSAANCGSCKAVYESATTKSNTGDWCVSINAQRLHVSTSKLLESGNPSEPLAWNKTKLWNVSRPDASVLENTLGATHALAAPCGASRNPSNALHAELLLEPSRHWKWSLKRGGLNVTRISV